MKIRISEYQKIGKPEEKKEKKNIPLKIVGRFS